jgi:hypothetical protein
MNIKIKNFQKKIPYSNSGKNKLLAALGLAASLGIAGCETTSVTSGDPAMPESSSSTGLIEMPESSSSVEEPESSSSIDIPVVGIPAMPEPELVPEEFDPDKIIPIVIEEP